MVKSSGLKIILYFVYGVTWTGGTEIDLYKKCDEEWKRSKKSYGEWLEKTHPEKYI